MATEEGFPMRLRMLRERAGLSQSELAKAANVPTASLKNWEQGRREPLLSALVALADALKVTLDMLAGRESLPLPAGPAPPAPVREDPPLTPPSRSSKRKDG